jgi:hypothetical protein
MAKTKEKSKKSQSVNATKIINEFHKIGEDIKTMLQSAKNKYDKADPKTKEALIAGVASAAALIAGVIGYKKMKRKK